MALRYSHGRTILFFAFAGLVLTSAPILADTAPEIFKRVSPSVLFVATFDSQDQIGRIGSGVVLTTSGLLATNRHVIEGANQVDVRLPSGKIFTDIAVVYSDEKRDLAILFVAGQNLPAAKLGDSDKIEVGEDVLAIGNPHGLENTLSKGIVSGIRQEGPLRYIQTTVPLSPGSSGGPIINMKGEIIGLAIGVLPDSQNLNFAMPINDVRFALKKVLAKITAAEQLAKKKAEDEAARQRARAKEEERREAAEAEATRRAAQEEARRRAEEEARRKTAEEEAIRKAEAACTAPSNAALAESRKSGEVLGVVIDSELKAGRCLYIVRKPDGTLLAFERSQVAIRPAPEQPVLSERAEKETPTLETPGLERPVKRRLPPPPRGEMPSATGSISLDVSDFPFTWYLRQIQQKISERWAPPRGSVAGGETAVVLFEIGWSGEIREPELDRPSGNFAYDQSALRAIKEASPFPPLPREYKKSALRIQFTFEYRPEGEPPSPAGFARPMAVARETELYQTAYIDYTKGNYTLAIAEFQEFLRLFPDSDLADDAQYYIGEARFSTAREAAAKGEAPRAQEEYERAAREFREFIVRYPYDHKALMALYKEGLIVLELGYQALAEARFQYLVEQFPATEAAIKAKEQLAVLRARMR